VQRDYLYGWLLADLYGDNPVMHDRLVFQMGRFEAVMLAGYLPRWKVNVT
jgi:hypothetical protein